MVPLIFTWPEGLAYWIVSVWFFIPEMRVLRGPGGVKAKSSQDAGSINVIMIGGQVGTLGAFACALLIPGATILQFRSAVYWLGVIILIVAGLLRRHCFRMLKEHFTGSVIVQSGQPVIERGAYRWVRHPSYSAAFLLYFALGLVLTNWVSMLVANLSAIVMYSYRIRVEERALISTLGETYLSYMRRTKRLIPFIL
jgi:protein-S-isoprenylcysteine O-methyltransferase Ste14